ncbi:MAG: transketolase family protein [Bacteroidia bacterium]|nr:transketolase family protein [Bacteroidia bacterium]MDW8303064.1 transketolase C-terminal domain-containing protein [Bacteroidia bacterium]
MELKDTRSGFGAALELLGEQNSKVVGLCADLTGSLMMTAFKNKFPERFFQAGVAEANMIGVAAGLATQGKIPFAATFANFATGRVFDQIRQSVAYSYKNVKICASHAGLTLGEDGATHQILEDIGLMRMLPNMTVINPADYNQTYLATLAIAEYYGPVYLRFGRPKVPVFTDINAKFEIGKAVCFKPGKDVSIFATGHLLYKALQAASILAQQGIDAEVINVHTIKPLDEEMILDSVSKTKRVVSAEEHQKNGGLGDAIAQLLVQRMPVRMKMVAVEDKFGESGTPEQLLQKYGLTENDIVKAVQALVF